MGTIMVGTNPSPLGYRQVCAPAV